MSTLLLASCGQRGNKAAAGTPATSEEQAVAAEVVTPAIPKVGDKFVDFTIAVSEGKAVKFSDYIGCGKVVLVDFWASWCGPCKMLGPVISQIAEEYEGKVKVGKVNVDDEEELAMEYGIQSIPTVLLFKGGEVVEQSLGFKPKAFFEDLIK